MMHRYDSVHRFYSMRFALYCRGGWAYFIPFGLLEGKRSRVCAYVHHYMQLTSLCGIFSFNKIMIQWGVWTPLDLSASVTRFLTRRVGDWERDLSEESEYIGDGVCVQPPQEFLSAAEKYRH